MLMTAFCFACNTPNRFLCYIDNKNNIPHIIAPQKIRNTKIGT